MTDLIVTDYTEVPTEDGFIRVTAENPGPGVSEPVVVSNEIHRRKVGETDWTRIAVEEVEANPATFARASTAVKQDGSQVATGVPRAELAGFGNGITIEEGTTNLLDTGDAPVVPPWNKGANLTDQGNVASPFSGVSARRYRSIGVGNVYLLQNRPVTALQSYTMSVWERLAAGSAGGFVGLQWKNSGGTTIRFDTMNFNGGPPGGAWGSAVLDGTWRRAYLGAVAPAGAVTCDVWLIGDLPNGADIDICRPQFENKSYPTSYQAPGTARAAETLSIPRAGVFNNNEGTIEVSLKLFNPTLVLGRPRRIVSAGDTTNGLLLGENGAGKLRWEVFSGGALSCNITDSVNLPLDTVTKIAAVWKSNDFRLYKNGVLVGSDSSGAVPTLAAAVAELGVGLGGVDQINGLLDDLRISNTAHSAAKIAADYALGGPLPVEDDTTYKHPFDGGLEATHVTTYDDYAVASEQDYEYKVKAIGANNTTRESLVSAPIHVSLVGVWLHDPEDASGTARGFRQRRMARGATKRVQVATHVYAGRARPVPEFGTRTEEEVEATVVLIDPVDVAALREMHERRAVLCYRDSAGRKVFGVIASMPETDVEIGTAIALKVEATDFDEAV
jgi:hypothetical protein